MRTILDLRRGERAVIARIAGVGDDEITVRRLHEMGFDDGVEIELLHLGPVGGDPLALRVGTMVVGLRRRLAAMIAVEPASAASDGIATAMRQLEAAE